MNLLVKNHHKTVLVLLNSTIKRLWNLFGNKSSASQTVVKRHCLCGGSASWSPASKLAQALYPLKERHLYRTVTSGRLGAKRLRLSEFLSMGIFRFVGEFQHHWLQLFCQSRCFPQNSHSQQKKKHWDYFWKWLLLQSSTLRVRFAGIPP